MELPLLIANIILLVVILILIIIILIKKQSNKEDKSISNELDNKLSLLRTEINNTLVNIQTSLSSNIDIQLAKQSTSQNDKLELLIKSINDNLNNVKIAINENTNNNEKQLELIRTNVENTLKELQNDNNKKLEEMRLVVDEKLQKTLDDRLSNSFKVVTEGLLKVYESIGEMQTLATSVGDLKKVLSNVKTRGILGETQLGNILEQLLSYEQYETNVVTKKGSKDPVEFAIKLPGNDNSFVYLPIDAKFPMDTYQAVLDAYETSNQEVVKTAINNLTSKIKKFAKDIHDKYIDVPNTTDFGIMFLPFEGLYAEVVKTGVTEDIQRDYKIVISGPTTMAALLNSLQIGFKTLAIQKRSSEVWNILGAVKTEFNNFEKVLDATQNRINQASSELEKLVGIRTRKIKKTLDEITELPLDESNKIID